jgi:hypothetical protein
LKKEQTTPPKEKGEREERLAAALRANLKRRKAQARQRVLPDETVNANKDGGDGQDQH